MPLQNPSSRYRIGDYARNLGVTPDFLKHYENKGLIAPSYTDSGYRIFNFDETYKIVEYMCLRNYGVNIRDMGRLLTAEPAEALNMLEAKAADMEKDIARRKALLKEHRRLAAWLKERRGRASDWEVREVGNYLFLPHSDGRAFVQDQEAFDLLPVWYDWLPLVKSSMCVLPSERPDAVYSCHWGLCVREKHALRYGLARNKAVRVLPGGRAFVWNFAQMEPDDLIDALSQGRHPMFNQLRALGLRPKGPMFSEVEVKLKPHDAHKWSCGRVIVPLAD